MFTGGAKRKFRPRKGFLTIAGIGYVAAWQITREADAAVRNADKVFYLADQISALWLKQVNDFAESLQDCYSVGKSRHESYEEMIERILSCVRDGRNVCVVLYGHPGVFAYPTHEAIRRARNEGYSAKMLPGISAEDCLFADLGVDPGLGCQTFEATDFLIRKRNIDTSSILILWQIGCIGVGTYYESYRGWNPEGVRILADVLQKLYGPRHEVVVYEASIYPICDPIIERVRLAHLGNASITVASTLYVPPRGAPCLDRHMVARLRASYPQNEN